MSFTPEKIPTTREELTFKVIQTYDDLLTQHGNGLITSAQLDTAVRALILAAGWAIDKSTLKLLSEANIEEDESFRIEHHFRRETGKYYCIQGNPKQGTIKLIVEGVELNSWWATDNSIHFNFTAWYDKTCDVIAKKFNAERI